MWFAGVEEDSGSVVGEVCESVDDAFDSFDQVVHGFGDSVGVVGVVVGEDLGVPGLQSCPEFLNFGWHHDSSAVIYQFIEESFAVFETGLLVELS